jgi:P-type Cu+ transporter
MSTSSVEFLSESDNQATIQLKIGGMSCSFCANSIEKALFKQKGVEEVHVSLAHEEALVRFRTDKTNPTSITDTMKSLGFLIRDPNKVKAFQEQQKAEREELTDLLTAAGFAIVLVGAMATMWLGLLQFEQWHVWAAWAAATFVFLWNGRRIIRMAFGAARRGITNQHVLLSIGAIGAYIGGVLGAPVPWLNWYGFVGFPSLDFFGVVVFLTTYHLLSGYISMLVRSKASDSVRKLLDLQPPTARVIRNGIEEEVDIDDVIVGDHVRIRPGDKVPVDGRVLEGTSAIDESLVTGEPIPTDKAKGAEVIGGSINQTGALLVEVTKVGEDSFLRQVARHVEEAKAMKPGIIVLVDRVLKHYVPVVLTISFAALLFWGLAPDSWTDQPNWVRAIYAAVTVLVMGYPCALGMATPLALIRGGGMAAEKGILIRSGEAFQVLKDVTHIVLDKTGTITAGKPSVTAVEPLSDLPEDEVLMLAAAVEDMSEHPLARAIVTEAEKRKLAVDGCKDFQSATGAGVKAVVGSRKVLVGTVRYLGANKVDTDAAADLLARHEEMAQTAVLVAVDGKVAGIIAISDAIKPDAPSSVAEMKARGLTPLLVTGDNERTARAVARQVGIDEVRAQVLPQDKAEIVRALQAEGGRVAMVGDGINDAPALMQADVGIAIGAGTDIAIESSDVIIMGDRVGAIIEAREIGAASYRKTVQNLWLAFIFNGIGVPLATTGWVHPSWAMLAMATSVTTVLANSFGGKLRGIKRPAKTPDVTVDSQRVFSVPEIHCAGCVDNISLGLALDGGVAEVSGDVSARTMTISYDSEKTSPGRLQKTIKEIGYNSSLAT